MKSLNISEIQVNERQREDFKEKPIEELSDSIRRVGLIHAPVVDTNHNLVAGERRLRAIALLEGVSSYRYGEFEFNSPEVPVHVVTADDPKILFEIELEENLRRENLTPMEQARAIANLHNIRAQEVPEQTVKATAQEVAKLQGKQPAANDQRVVAEALLVDQFSDDPEVREAAKQSLRKAAKVAKKKAELTFLAALGDFDEEESADGREFFRVYLGDAGEVMEEFEAKQYDILLFDPPYGVNANKFGEQTADVGHQYDDTFDDAANFLDKVMGHQRVLKDNAHVLMFCSPDLFHEWKMYYENHGFKVWPRPLIWYKQRGHLPVPDRGPRYAYEAILFAVKGKRRVASTVDDVFTVPSLREKIHAAEKPGELLSKLLNFIAMPGDRILDPCCGSGSLFAAARDKELYVDGIELDEQYYFVAKDRAGL